MRGGGAGIWVRSFGFGGEGWRVAAELPEDLAKDAHPDGGGRGVERHAADEAAEVGGCGVSGVAAGVLGGFEDFGEEGGEAFEFCGGRRGGGGDCRGRGRCGADEFVEADGDGLAQVHGRVADVGVGVHGDGQERVAEAELVVREAGFFRAEQQGDAGFRRAGEFRVDDGNGFRKGKQRVAEFALPDGGGAEHERAVGDGFGEVSVRGGGGEYARGVNGGAGAFKGTWNSLTIRRWRRPKSCMARAAAPMF